MFGYSVCPIEEKTKKLIAKRIAISLNIILAGLGILIMPLWAQAITLTGTVPLITENIVVSDISSSGSTVSWKTNGDSTSQVLYDTNSHANPSDYAFNSALNPAPVSSHSVVLSGLASQQTYYFRVRSTAEGLTAISIEVSFTTLAGSGGGGGGGLAPSPGVTNLMPYINSAGVFNLAATASSADGKVIIGIPEGVQGITLDGSVLKSVSIVPINTPLTLPEGISVVGLEYELGPEGAIFKPGIILTIGYSPTDLPAGVDERKLVIASWDKATSEWSELQGEIDPVLHTITASITHFSRYAILAHTRPASFSIRSLVITPDKVIVGETVSISVTVVNTGDLLDVYRVIFKVRGVRVAQDDVSVPGGSSQTLTYRTAQETAGKYEVTINGLTGSFNVVDPVVSQPSAAAFEISDLTITPHIVNAGQIVQVTFIVVNTGRQSGTYNTILNVDNTTIETRNITLAAGEKQRVTFELVKNEPGVHTVETAGYTGSFKVMVPEKASTWWIWSGIIAMAVAAVMIIQSIRRRKA